MKRIAGLAIVGLTAFSLSAQAQAPSLERVRGTIDSVSGNTLTIKSRDGQTVPVTIDSGTKFAWVVPSSLSDLKSGDFIGTATKGPKMDMKALEVVIFPNSMRGTGEGHYAWDSLPANAMGGGGMVKSSMTNGTVKSSGAPEVKSSMTNGTVGSSAAKNGGKDITVSYDNGQKLDIHVPPDAPIVAFVPGDKSVMTAGAKAFIIAAKPEKGSSPEAKFVAVGKNGLTPPM